MTKLEYMHCLKKNLRHLPKSDFERAIDYFEEYFADAGEENTEQAIVDLGNPDEAAEQVITSFAIQNAEAPTGNIKKGLKSIWVGVLAIMAAPIALPLAFCIGLTIFLLLFTVLLLLAVFVFSGALFVVMSPFCLAAAFSVITYSFPAFISCLGTSFTFFGFGILITLFSMKGMQKFLHWITSLIGKIVAKGGGSKNEKI